MTYFILILLLGLYPTGEPVEMLPPGECPAESETTRSHLRSFANISDVEVDRRGLFPSRVESVRVLADESDGDACAWFESFFINGRTEVWPDGSPVFEYAYYEWRGTYYVVEASVQPQDGSIAVGMSSVYVFDNSLEYVDGVFW